MLELGSQDVLESTDGHTGAMTTNSDTHPQGTQIDRATPLEDPDTCDFTPAQMIAMLELGSQDALESTDGHAGPNTLKNGRLLALDVSTRWPKTG